MAETLTAANGTDGVTRIEAGTPLTRLHFFDGKFLRADALTLEQNYHRELVRFSNRAGGWGIVHGFGISSAAGKLVVSPGLAITPTGRTILMTEPLEADIGGLVGVAAKAAAALGNAAFDTCGTAAPPSEATPGQGIYEILIRPAQALCDTEPVYGKLCEEACVTDTQQPYWREGMVLRLRPIALELPDPKPIVAGLAHLRNRVASAYFAAEPWLTPPLLSSAGLAAPVWCNPAVLYDREDVPLGLLVREGEALRVLDAWSARRERMEPQARGYWQGRMRMRPWTVFLAQILQFQCQLSSLFRDGSPVFEPQPDDDCARLRQLFEETVSGLEEARRAYEKADTGLREHLGDRVEPVDAEALGAFKQPAERMAKLSAMIGDLQKTLTPITPNRLLISGGILELPPAGYLPVIVSEGRLGAQLQRIFGEGVDLTLCAAPIDHLGHLLEEAQHMDRISLTRGLDDPAAKEQVEVFVPDGEVVTGARGAPSIQWQGTVIWELVQALPGTLTAESNDLAPAVAPAVGSTARQQPALARTFREPSGRNTLALLRLPAADGLEEGYEDLGSYVRLDIDGDPFAAARGQTLPAALEIRERKQEQDADSFDGVLIRASGAMEVVEARSGVDPAFVRARLSLDFQTTIFHLTAPAESRAGNLVLSLALTRQGEATRSTLSFPAKPGLPVSWRISWTQPPRVGLLDVISDSIKLPANRHPADLSEIPPLASDDPVRTAAMKAAGRIGAATRDEAFASQAAQALFGPGIPAVANEIRARRDFVMFRRRRQVACLQPPPPAPEPELREPDPVEPAPEAKDRLHRVFAIPSSISRRVREMAAQAVQGETDFLPRLEEIAIASATVAFKGGGTEFDKSVLDPVADTGLGAGEPLALVAVDLADPDLALEDHVLIAKALGPDPARDLQNLQVAGFGEGAFEASIFIQRR